MSSLHNLTETILKLETERELRDIIEDLRKISANEKSEVVRKLIDISLEKAENLNDKRSIIFLLELKVRQIYNLSTSYKRINLLMERIYQLSSSISFDIGFCLYYQLKWIIEKFRGNKEESSKAIEIANKYISKEIIDDEYVYYGCKYAYALELWFNSRNLDSSYLLEECCQYFYSNDFYHGLVMSLGILTIIYQQTQNKEKSMDLTKKILERNDFLRNISEEIKSIIHFFIGFSQELSFNLNLAEEHLNETIRILRPIYKTSIYSSYYITALSYLTATNALQGKLELAYNQMIDMDGLIEEGITIRNLDDFNRKQLKHIFDLTKFYIYSRLQSFESKDLLELKQTILKNISRYYSNSIFFSEFLLNAELTKEQLIEIRDLKTPSTKRVEHIINFLIEKTTNTDEQSMINSISELKRRPARDRMTYEEKAFADLLAAQEYYKLRRFSEIYPLLKKYKENLNRIEILELRIFMEAFIQIGAFKNGDPMGPALQYVAIRKCQQYGFSRLENKLLNYLELQHKDIIQSSF